MISVSPSGPGAEGEGFEPSSPSRGTRLSRTARQTVSDYLPFEWTHRESNPDLRHARATSSPWTMGPSIADSAEWTAGESNPDLRRAMPVSSHWTMGPSITDSAEWTAGESNPDLRRAMPVSSRWTSSPIDESRSARESNSVSLPTKEVCCRNTCRPDF